MFSGPAKGKSRPNDRQVNSLLEKFYEWLAQ